MRIMKAMMVFFSVMGLILPSQSIAAPKELSFRMQEVMSQIKPTRSDEMLAEYYMRLERFIGGQAKTELAPLLKDQGREKMPKVQIDGNTVTFRDGAQTARMEIEEKGEEILIRVNGQLLTKAELESPTLLVKSLQKIIGTGTVQNSKWDFLYRTLVPESHAFSFMTLLAGVAVGALGFWAYKKFLAPDSAKCTSNSCCQVGKSVKIGCCVAIGGLEISPEYCTDKLNTNANDKPKRQNLAPAADPPGVR